MYQGFGDGIDPSPNGVNIYNESDLFHEAIHGMTAQYDDILESTLGVSDPSINVSIYIKNNVLSACPISQRPGQ